MTQSNPKPRPHDLLALTADAPPFPDAPAWVDAALARAPFVVVRRAPPLAVSLAMSLATSIAVGVRGATRGERFGAWIEPRYIGAILTPETLRQRQPDDSRAHIPAFVLLRAIAPVLDATGLAWGPAGSAGFELASGVPAVTHQSDLDVLMRAPQRLSRDDASRLFDALSREADRAATRIDVQIETPDAAFSLAEYAHRNVRVLLRREDGPRLAADPWAVA
ncbi:malonate decarboxylase holo-ACP synthase [Caballeronia sp. Lep1P3]|uniref:malonate decarboxylase holo-ACP synthase n=1 Tax=Caballeronia sp. Lep1P3 TaxID=2878150 RepID=UPI001FD2DFEA|nr:malonate decarboxylase holo-ACP synthase [Caballeronia sp. Lep1P3]